MKYRIEIDTRLTFGEPVREHHGEMRLVPRESEVQQVGAVQVTTVPPAGASVYTDCFGNRVDCFDVIPPHTDLTVRIEAEVETLLENPFAYTVVPAHAERAWLDQALARQPQLLDYVLHRSELTPGAEDCAELLPDAPVWGEAQTLLDAVLAARDWVAERLALGEAEDGVPGLAAALEAGRGDCRSLAHALIAVVRSWGAPARYVCGFEDVAADDEVPAERAAPHAWAEVLIPGAGWRGFDPTYGLVVNDHYVGIAVGRDAGDAQLLRQVFKGGEGETALLRLQLCRRDGATSQQQSQEQ